MSATIEKRLHLSRERAATLSSLAKARGTTEDELIARALDMLFAIAEDGRGEELSLWTGMSAPAFDHVWNNPMDAAYDNWRELYGVPER